MILSIVLLFVLLNLNVPAILNAQQIQDAWQFECPRDEIKPKYWIDEQVKFENRPTFVLEGNGKEYALGCWVNNVATQPGASYQFTTHYRSLNIDEPLRSVLGRILWIDVQGKQLGRAEYPKTLRDKAPQNWNIIQQTYLCPEGAVFARIELVFRWDADGVVHFGGTHFAQVAPTAPRLVKLATVYYRPKNMTLPQANLNQFAELAVQAARKGADIVCLPEGITKIMTGITYVDIAEQVPGPSTQFFGNIAKKHRIYIVAGIYERDGPIIYNTSVLIDRDGNLAGKYRKTCLPRGEIQGGITPGNDLPVFDTDFGRIGMMICWDVTFPEPAQSLALKGAEIIMLPIWGGILNLAKARAIENQVFIVSSSYDKKEMKLVFKLSQYVCQTLLNFRKIF